MKRCGFFFFFTECASDEFVNSEVNCEKCECDETGSSSDSCSVTTGTCTCYPGFAGIKCEVCDIGFTGIMCSECANGYEGTNCEKCSDGFGGFPNCTGMY